MLASCGIAFVNIRLSALDDRFPAITTTINCSARESDNESADAGQEDAGRSRLHETPPNGENALTSAVIDECRTGKTCVHGV
jgi:hypothetical protein